MVEAGTRIGFGLLHCCDDECSNLDRLARVFVAPDRYVSWFLESVDAYVVRQGYVCVRCAVREW